MARTRLDEAARGGRRLSVADAAGIVLAGGRSSRMGTPKAALEWHGSTLLRRVVGLVGRSVDGPVIVVCAPGGADVLNDAPRELLVVSGT